MSIILGVDTGLKGAFASLNSENQALTVLTIPIVKASGRGNDLAWGELVDLFDLVFPKVDHAIIERVGARPGQGVSSMFKFGTVYGAARMLVCAHRIPYTLVTPNVWKKKMGLPSGSKDAAVIRAGELFPASVSEFRGPRGGKIDGAAEAALLAYYGLTHGNLIERTWHGQTGKGVPL